MRNKRTKQITMTKIILKNKIIRKLGLTLVLTLLLLFSVIGCSSEAANNNKSKSSTEISTEQHLKQANNEINEFIAKMEGKITALSSNSVFSNINVGNNEDSALVQLENIKKSDSNIMYTYFATNNHNFYIFPNINLPKQFDPTSREWYKNTVNNAEKINFTEPYMDVATGDFIVTLTKSVMNDKEVIGVSGLDVNLKGIIEKLTNIEIDNSGYLIISDEKGRIILHPDQNMLGKSTTDDMPFWGKVKTEQNGYIQYTHSGQTKFLGFVTNKKTGWKLMLVTD